MLFEITETWKVMALDAAAKTCTLMALCLENIGVMRYEEFISMIISLDYTQPLSDEHVTVTDTTFVDIPVRLYLPKRKSEAPRPAVIYFHGGGYCFGSFKQRAFDFLNRCTAKKLDAVVVGMDYRLAPQHHFPAQFEDGITAVKFFLQDKILAKYGVDPTRIAISGDSSGGTLAAAVTQQVQTDPEVKHKLKLQALLYPGLQVIDTSLPSHRDNEHGIVLTRDIAIKLVTLYGRLKFNLQRFEDSFICCAAKVEQAERNMGKTILLLVAVVLVAYYVYVPLPGDIEEPWKLMLQTTRLKVMMDLVSFAELLGINHYMDTIQILMKFQELPATSDENVTVTDTAFNSVPVRIYVPKRKSESLRRGLFFIHGGGWCLGSNALLEYDLLARQIAERLDAVVLSTNYGLAPKYHFPRQFEDVYDALRWFLQEDILERYGVDPQRVGVSGDSAGGNLAAAVAQQIVQDPDVKTKLKVQALVYPALQALDMNLPSYQEGLYFPILSPLLMTRFWSEYFTTDRTLEKAMLLNQHVPMESSHLFQFVNWSSLLPERYKKGYFYKSPTPGSSELSKKYPGFLDVKACPLLANDNILSQLPRTYIITCQYDVLRDDGLMYAMRLQNAGVHVTHHHVENGFHGAFTLHGFKISYRLQNQYFSWLMENL
ncbi:arylacetamide deacetylase-like protein [Cricetulus griseus]|nr:arylacetamide deacetylase-like protein [Cricetulus griseus]